MSTLPTAAAAPIGTILASVYKHYNQPSGWLVCDGSLIPNEYQALRNLLQSDRTPNLIGRTLIGTGVLAAAQTHQDDNRDPHFANIAPTLELTVGYTGGESVHTLTIPEIPAHVHSINNGDFGVHHRSFEGEDGNQHPFETSPDTPLGGTQSTGGNGAHFNVQPYYAVTYIICAA